MINNKNKRGDVPIVILVIGVLVICLLAMMSFFFSDRAIKNNFGQITLVDKVVVEHDKMAAYSSMGLSQSQIDVIFNVRSDVEGRFIQMEQGGVKVRYNLGQ